MREFAIQLLQEGVSPKTWKLLASLLEENGCCDIINQVQFVDGRIYLPENHSLHDEPCATVDESQDSWSEWQASFGVH